MGISGQKITKRKNIMSKGRFWSNDLTGFLLKARVIRHHLGGGG